MENKYLIEVSARHVHLTREAMDVLFGEGEELEARAQLTQKGVFAAKQRVDVIGPKGTLKKMSILAPLRKYVQIEVSKTDARALGVEPPVRESGNVAGSPGCTLVGPKGTLEISQGVIVAKRHMHMNTATAEAMNIKDGDTIVIEVNDGERALLFKDVVVRISPYVTDFVHIDTDEGNAAGIVGHTYGSIVKL